MTLPDERYRSLVQTKQFLIDLLSSRMTPRVPRIVRQRARNLLKHYPTDYHIEMMTINMPKHFAKEIEPVERMFLKYQLEKENNNA